MGEDGAIRTENFYGRSSTEDKTSYKKVKCYSRDLKCSNLSITQCMESESCQVG